MTPKPHTTATARDVMENRAAEVEDMLDAAGFELVVATWTDDGDIEWQAQCLTCGEPADGVYDEHPDFELEHGPGRCDVGLGSR